METPISQKVIQKVAVVFLDDMNLVSGGSNMNMKIWDSIDMYNDLHTAIGRYIKYSKTMCYS